MNGITTKVVNENEHGMMKKFIVSVGLVAAGSMSLHADYSPDASDTSKIWTLSGTLRGFYDDNYLTAPRKEGSAGLRSFTQFHVECSL